MADNVFVNQRAVVHAGSTGQAAGTMPDVCLCPPGPPNGPVPTPLPNTARASSLVNAASSVLVNGNPIAVASSRFDTSTGNEAASHTGGGVLTHTTQGSAQFASYSTDVLVEGEHVPRHMDLMTQNHQDTLSNTPPGIYMSYASSSANKEIRSHTADIQILSIEAIWDKPPTQCKIAENNTDLGAMEIEGYEQVIYSSETIFLRSDASHAIIRCRELLHELERIRREMNAP